MGILSVNVTYNVRLNHDAFVAKANQALTFLEQVIPGQVRDTLIGKFIQEAMARDLRNGNDLLITFKLSDHGEEQTVLTVSRGFVEEEAIFEV